MLVERYFVLLEFEDRLSSPLTILLCAVLENPCFNRAECQHFQMCLWISWKFIKLEQTSHPLQVCCTVVERLLKRF